MQIGHVSQEYKNNAYKLWIRIVCQKVGTPNMNLGVAYERAQQ